MTDDKTKTSPEKMKLESLDISEQRRAELKNLFPSVFSETKNDQGELVEGIDFEKLKAEIGTFSDVFESRRERYGMDWPGKKDCMKLIQHPSIATLKPCREESVNFDETENLFIEGDNLEVLKLLQKSYYGKVKMIYIDPPYNTGKEFIYPDNYSESLDTHLAYAGLVDDEGKKFSTNTENEGRYHTKWLNMMYPRLYLARNLLREDGVIFISIDDNEVANLRKVCDQVYGEENFVTEIIWQKKVSPSNDATWFSSDHDTLLLYSRDKSIWRPHRLPLNPRQESYYKNPDNDPRGDWNSSTYTCNKTKDERPNLYYSIKNPNTGVEVYPSESAVWAYSKEVNDQHLTNGLLYWGKDGKSNKPRFKKFLTEAKAVVPRTIWPYSEVGHTQSATQTIKELLPEIKFETPKPPELISRMLQIGTYKDGKDIVLDFFSGSCSTAHAVLDLNKEDGGNRNFVLVQLPEPCDEKSSTFKAGYKNIADIGKERIRRVIKKIEEEQSGQLALDGDDKQDLGFKVFKLDQSNFDIWDGSNPDASSEEIAKQLSLYVDHIDPDATPEDILYELLLKSGYKPTEKVEVIEDFGSWILDLKKKDNTDYVLPTEFKNLKSTIYNVAEGSILICLEEEITRELIDAVAEAEPHRFICLDKGFQGNDQLKANAVQTFAARNQGRETEHQIVFRTV